ncbi:MAG: chorismate mutase [Syntrophomonadaceae bacterium]|nr:chorismate mutase [Syntrophomonadaceae bacterium]
MIGVRAVRGAITVEENSAESILEATRVLLEMLVQENDIAVDDLISAIFSVTRDLNAAFPATAAREMGWSQVPLLCCNEVEVPGALPRCIRVLLHFYSTKGNQELKPIYLKEAARLREDIEA